MITINRKNPTPGEVTSSLTNAADGQGLNFANQGNLSIVNNASKEFGTADFSVEFVLNQTGDNTHDNYIFYTHDDGNSRLYVYNDISADTLNLGFVNSSGSTFTKSLAYDMSEDYGEPTHYVITADRNGDATLYKNGNSVATVDISDQASVDIGASNTNPGLIATAANNYGVLGTFYRFRAFNTLADAKLLFQRADVPQTLTANLLMDFDLAFASPTQSLMVQDRAGNSDATASASGVSQTQKIPQLNATAISVSSATARTPADGQIVADKLKVGSGDVSPDGDPTLLVTDTSAGGSVIIRGQSPILAFDKTSTGTATILTDGGGLNVKNGTLDAHGSTHLSITSAGQVGINVASPGYKLDVEESTGNEIARFQGANSGSLVFRNDASNVFRMYAGASDALGLSGGNVSGSSHLEISSTGNVHIGTGSLASVGTGPTLGLTGTAPEITLRDSATGTPYSIVRTNDSGDLVLESDRGDDAANSKIDFWVDGASRATIDSAGKIAIGNNVPMWSGSYGGALVLKGNNASSDRYAQLSIVDSTGSIVQDGLRVTSAGTVTINKPQDTTTGTPFSSAALKLLPSGTQNTTGLTSIALSTSVSDNYGFLISGHRAGSSGTPTLRISSHDNSSTGTEVLNINNAGLASFAGGVTVSGGLTTLGSFSELTIASGGITVTSSVHTVDTQGDASSDNLNTINGGSTGSILYLTTADSSRDVTLKDDSDNLRLAGDCTLASSNDSITLIKNGSIWREISRSTNG